MSTLKDKTAVVTGSTSGIDLQGTLKAMAKSHLKLIKPATEKRTVSHAAGQTPSCGRGSI
jgi:NADP-dependent 3-hydroxy acid dehydrogenase YdfG